jgi:hypothetical protein
MVNLTSVVTYMRHDTEFAMQLAVLHSQFEHHGDSQENLLKPNSRAIWTQIYHHEVIFGDMSRTPQWKYLRRTTKYHKRKMLKSYKDGFRSC